MIILKLAVIGHEAASIMSIEPVLATKAASIMSIAMIFRSFVVS